PISAADKATGGASTACKRSAKGLLVGLTDKAALGSASTGQCSALGLLVWVADKRTLRGLSMTYRRRQRDTEENQSGHCGCEELHWSRCLHWVRVGCFQRFKKLAWRTTSHLRLSVLR
ncbi:MAG: hypothetical protein EB088_13890, partial [Betaproteobacteria bacterium]|nr:hypothetical protein [Betaproteobacteria bacterium]